MRRLRLGRGRLGRVFKMWLFDECGVDYAGVRSDEILGLYDTFSVASNLRIVWLWLMGYIAMLYEPRESSQGGNVVVRGVEPYYHLAGDTFCC